MEKIRMKEKDAFKAKKGKVEFVKISYHNFVQTIVFLSVMLILMSFASFSMFAQGANPCPTSTIPLPATPIEKDEFRFAAVGDTGTGDDNQIKLAKKMEEVQKITSFSLLLFLGDNVYKDGNPDQFPKKLYQPYENLQKVVEIRGVLGNHDVTKYPKGVKEQQQHFKMGDNTFYSFEKAKLVNFFGLDSNLLVDYQPKQYTTKTKADQNNWLIEQLANTTTKWNVVFMHHPVYSTSHRHGVFSSGDIVEYKKAWELEKLIKPKVQLVLVGHAHAYERITPQDGVRYFVSGAGAKIDSDDADNRVNFHACGETSKLSFMLFSIKPDSITFWSIDESGKAFDSGIIK